MLTEEGEHLNFIVVLQCDSLSLIYHSSQHYVVSISKEKAAMRSATIVKLIFFKKEQKLKKQKREKNNSD